MSFSTFWTNFSVNDGSGDVQERPKRRPSVHIIKFVSCQRFCTSAGLGRVEKSCGPSCDNTVAPLGLENLPAYDGLTAIAIAFRPFGPEGGYSIV
jgi:hypothetical protein